MAPAGAPASLPAPAVRGCHGRRHGSPVSLALQGVTRRPPRFPRTALRLEAAPDPRGVSASARPLAPLLPETFPVSTFTNPLEVGVHRSGETVTYTLIPSLFPCFASYFGNEKPPLIDYLLNREVQSVKETGDM